MKLIPIFTNIIFFSLPSFSGVNFKKIFQDRDACFLISEVESGKVLAEYNPARCRKRVTPCSSFKIPTALMAFEKGIQQFLNDFNYGNKDFSGGLKDSWVSSSLKISAYEQQAFIAKFWKEELSLSKKAVDLTKKIIFIKKIKNSELYGKTGTGCSVGHVCMDRPDKMIGNFVGVLKSGTKTYVFATNASDLKKQERPAGPRLRNSTIEILTEMGLVDD